MFKLIKINLIPRSKFTFVRNEVYSIIRNSKKSYYQNLLNNLKNDIKRSWQAINERVIFKCSSKRTIKEFIFNNKSYTGNYDMGNLLNEQCNVSQFRIHPLLRVFTESIATDLFLFFTCIFFRRPKINWWFYK